MESFDWFNKVILPVAFILSGFLAYLILKIIVSFSNKFKVNHKQERRLKTLNKIILNVIKSIIFIVVVLLILDRYGVNLTTILAGLGIVGLVVGLAFQDTIKDFLGGYYVISENQFSIGDIVEIKGFKGEVIDFGFKTTKIRSQLSGEIKTIRNRIIDEVTNFSTANSIAVVDIPISFQNDIDYVEKKLPKLFAGLEKKIDYLKEPIKYVGVIRAEYYGVIIRITVETKATKNYEVERVILKEIKKMFEKENIITAETEVKSVR